jgi:glycosyltransferase involved in cell wall biosynthesis
MKANGEKPKADEARPFRILHMNSAHTWRGGEQQTLWLCQGLRGRGHEIFLACQPDSQLRRRGAAAGIRLCPVIMRGEWDLWAVKNLAGLIHEECIEIIHFHTAHAHTLGLLAAQMTKVPMRFLTRRVDFHIHRHLLNNWKYGSALTAILAISEGIRRVLVEDGVCPQRVFTVPSGIDLARIKEVGDPSKMRGEFRIPQSAILVGIVAALAPHKDHRNFLEAAALVAGTIPEARFLIVGEGELRADLERLSASLGLSKKVIFAGFREDVLEITKGLDIFVMSSYLEGMGTALLDAMALGRPIVATKVGGIPDIVLDGKSGLLVPSRDPDELARAILKLARAPQLRDEMGAQGKEQARLFSIQRTVENTEAVYYRFASLEQQVFCNPSP